MKILDIENSLDDRVLRIKGVKESIIQEVIFFWRGRDLFFTHIKYLGSEIDVFRSWEGKVKESWSEESDIDFNLLFKGLGFAETKFGEKDQDFSFDDYLNYGEGKETEEKSVKYSKKINTLKKMKKELVLLNEVQDLRVWTNKNLEEVNSVGEGRFKVNFKGVEGHFKKRELLFDKIKSWEKSKKIVSERILKLEKESQQSNKKITSSIVDQKVIQPIWNYEKKKTTIQGHQNYIEINYKNLKCYIGRRAQENDYIRKEFGKKEDLWLHLDGMKSAHMIVKLDSQALEIQDFQILGSALVELTGSVIEEIPIVYTNVKNLKAVKGAPGKVTYKKEKHLKVYFDESWRQKLSIIAT